MRTPATLIRFLFFPLHGVNPFALLTHVTFVLLALFFRFAFLGTYNVVLECGMCLQ